MPLTNSMLSFKLTNLFFKKNLYIYYKMEIPTCNYTLDGEEYYIRSFVNDNYIPYVFGFVVSISSIGLLISIYNANSEYKQEIKNKIKLVIFVILILLFLHFDRHHLHRYATYGIDCFFKTGKVDHSMVMH